jgi:hypothetical protein
LATCFRTDLASVVECLTATSGLPPSVGRALEDPFSATVNETEINATRPRFRPRLRGLGSRAFSSADLSLYRHVAVRQRATDASGLLI